MAHGARKGDSSYSETTLARGTDDWSRGLGRLLGDREALTAALADQRRLPHIPPGMPIGAEGEDWPAL